MKRELRRRSLWQQAHRIARELSPIEVYPLRTRMYAREPPPIGTSKDASVRYAMRVLDNAGAPSALRNALHARMAIAIGAWWDCEQYGADEMLRRHIIELTRHHE